MRKVLRTKTLTILAESQYETIFQCYHQLPLNGRLPAWYIQELSGEPGTEQNIFIRGLSTISGN